MIGRRGLLAAATTAGIARRVQAMPDAAALPYGQRLAFGVIRQGSRIGSHELSFVRSDNGLDIRIAVNIAVGIGPLTLFRYTLRGLEQWRDGKVVHVDASTDDDGTPQSMRAERDARGLWVEGSKVARYLAPSDALPATHWNMAELDGPWINPQDGQLLHPRVAQVGSQPVALAGGRTGPASHFAMSGDVHLDLWYDTARRWCALNFAAKDGSLVRYELA